MFHKIESGEIIDVLDLHHEHITFSLLELTKCTTENSVDQAQTQP